MDQVRGDFRARPISLLSGGFGRLLEDGSFRAERIVAAGPCWSVAERIHDEENSLDDEGTSLGLVDSRAIFRKALKVMVGEKARFVSYL